MNKHVMWFYQIPVQVKTKFLNSQPNQRIIVQHCEKDWAKMSNLGGGGSHIDMVYVYVRVF